VCNIVNVDDPKGIANIIKKGRKVRPCIKNATQYVLLKLPFLVKLDQNGIEAIAAIILSNRGSCCCDILPP
jgi:hypothetical protein